MRIPILDRPKIELTRWAEHPPLLQARERLAQLETATATLDDAAKTARQSADAAATALLHVEGLNHLGRATDDELKAAREKADRTRKQASVSLVEIEDNKAALAAIHNVAPDIELEAKQAAHDTLRRRYKLAVAALNAALEAAAACNADVEQLQELARENFPGDPEIRDRRFPTYAGMPKMHWNELRGPIDGSSKLTIWQRDARASGFLE